MDDRDMPMVCRPRTAAAAAARRAGLEFVEKLLTRNLISTYGIDGDG
jgi:hypothetical protein